MLIAELRSPPVYGRRGLRGRAGAADGRGGAAGRTGRIRPDVGVKDVERQGRFIGKLDKIQGCFSPILDKIQG